MTRPGSSGSSSDCLQGGSGCPGRSRDPQRRRRSRWSAARRRRGLRSADRAAPCRDRRPPVVGRDGAVRSLGAGYRTVRYDAARTSADPRPTTSSSCPWTDARAVLDALGIGRAVLVGNSLGGMTAIDTAICRARSGRRGRRRGRRASVASTSSRPTRSEPSRRRRRAWKPPTRAIPAAFADFDVRLWVDGPGQPPDRVPSAIREAVRKMDTPLYADGRVAGHRAAAQPSANDRLADLRCPVLAVAGALDLPDVVQAARHLETNAPNARALVWPDVAHMIGMEQPERLAAASSSSSPRWSAGRSAVDGIHPDPGRAQPGHARAPAPAGTRRARPGTAIEQIGGLQAQEPASPYVALWSRLAGFQAAALDRAVHERRAVKAGLFRGTLHLVSADDYLRLHPAVLVTLRGLAVRDQFRNAEVGDIDSLMTAALAFADKPRDNAAMHDHGLASSLRRGASRRIAMRRGRASVRGSDSSRDNNHSACGSLRAVRSRDSSWSASSRSSS